MRLVRFHQVMARAIIPGPQPLAYATYSIPDFMLNTFVEREVLGIVLSHECGCMQRELVEMGANVADIQWEAMTTVPYDLDEVDE